MKKRSFSVLPPLVVLLAFAPATAGAVGTRHFVIESKSDFESGDLGTSAVDSLGRLSSGLSRKVLTLSEAPSIWAALESKDGLLLATGNEGKLLAVSGGTSRVLADTEELALSSLASAFGKILVAGLSTGTIYELDKGALKPFVKLEGTPNIYALAYDASSKALFVGTGPDGKVFRVTESGRAEVYFDSEEGHITSLLVSGKTLFVGTSGKARLFSVESPGRATVLHDFEGTEVRSLVSGKEREIFVLVNELSSGAKGDGPSGSRPAGPTASSPQKGKGSLFRLVPGSHPEELFARSDEHFTHLSLDERGFPVVGTGVEGRLYAISGALESRLILDAEARQIAFVDLTKNLVVTSDSASVLTTSRTVEASEWTSKPLDAGIVAKFGVAHVETEGDVQFFSRSGNTDEPDASWSDWAKFDGGTVASPRGRFLQIRAKLAENGRVSSIDVPFVTDNLRAVLTEVDAESNVKRKDSRGVAKSGGPRSDKASANIKLSWKVKNPDSDELRYFVEYQPVGSKSWFDLLDPGQVLTDEKVTWNTENLPEGRYRIRVTASDELSNPPGMTTRHSLESPLVLVDNSAPEVEGLKIHGRKVTFTVKDKVGPVERVEVRLEGREPWMPLGARDGIFDEAKEEIEADLSVLAPSGPALLIVRVFDSAGNSSVEHLALE